MLDLVTDARRDPRRRRTGPSDYIRIGDNLVPGLDPLAAGDQPPDRPAARPPATPGCASTATTGGPRRTVFWAAERALIPLAALLLAYLLGIVGLIPDPEFPFDPGLYPPGARGLVAFAALAAAVSSLATCSSGRCERRSTSNRRPSPPPPG